jgi:hypothetical protein
VRKRGRERYRERGGGVSSSSNSGGILIWRRYDHCRERREEASGGERMGLFVGCERKPTGKPGARSARRKKERKRDGTGRVVRRRGGEATRRRPSQDGEPGHGKKSGETSLSKARVEGSKAPVRAAFLRGGPGGVKGGARAHLRIAESRGPGSRARRLQEASGCRVTALPSRLANPQSA